MRTAIGRFNARTDFERIPWETGLGAEGPSSETTRIVLHGTATTYQLYGETFTLSHGEELMFINPLVPSARLSSVGKSPHAVC